MYSSQARAKRSRACGRSTCESLEVLAAANNALGLESLPDDVAVLLRLAPNLLEDGVDVEELEGALLRRFSAALKPS